MRYAIVCGGCAAVLLVVSGCGGEMMECIAQNHCRMGATGAECMPGYGWQDPTDPDNYTCVPMVVDTPPDTEIVSAPPALTSSRQATIHCRGTDDIGITGFECRLDQAAYAPCEPETRVVGLVEGEHVFECRAYDTAGQPDPTPAVVAWTVDTTALDTEIESGPEPITNQATARFEFAAAGGADLERFDCSLDDAPFETCASPLDVGPLDDGSHRFVVAAVDLAGNVDPTPAEHAWTSQTVGLATAIVGPPEFHRWTRADFTLAAVGNGTLDGFYCRLDAAPFASCDASVSFIDLPEGEHTFEAYAVDTAGNVESPPASHVWVVDTTRPTTSWVGTPPPDSDDSIELSFASDEPGTFVCQVDSDPKAACTSPLVLTGLGPGKHAVSIKAVDRAGNVEILGRTHAWVAHCQSLSGGLTTTALAWSADGEGVIAGDSDGTLMRWNAATGATEFSVAAHSSTVEDVDVVGDLVATGSDDGTAAVWDAATGAPVATFTGFPSRVNSVALDNAGARLATGCIDGVVRVLDVELGTELSRYEFSGYTQPLVAWRPDSNELLVTSGNFLMLWNSETDDIVWSLHQSDRITSIDWTADGAKVASGADDGTVRISSASDGALVHELDVGWDVGAVAWFSDGSHLLVADDRGAVTTWDAGSWVSGWSISLTGFIADVALSPDDSALVGAWGAYRCELPEM